ncbi:hypothetical protein SNE40_004661 [Patella caerulea]|uniref:Uncharacterized protein n=1 Tax=Patella caerulea TaxID=87958 RepID=A0AAN8Q5S4_PATCE
MSRYTPEKPSPLARHPLTRSRSKDHLNTKTPLTPLQHLKRKFEHELEKKVKAPKRDEISPVLYNLRNTPVKTLKEKQQILVEKHNDTKQRCDQINIGGGISLWPQMENMRLTEREIIRLLLSCICLVFTLFFIFHKFHGSSLSSLKSFNQELKRFSLRHTVVIDQDYKTFRNSIMSWHQDFRILIRRIEVDFDMSSLSPAYQIFLLLYVVAIIVLVYFLVDNIFSKNKLSPRRIKNWVRLLVLVSTWSLLISYWLTCAYRLEQLVHNNILRLSEVMGDVIETEFNLDIYKNILTYWRTKCLLPTSHGIILILGAVPVRDVVFYLQYYSIPILTIILTPIGKLIIALIDIYSIKTF